MCQYHINYYEILRISTTASKKDINARFRKELVLKFHPDKIKGRVVTKVDENRWSDINNSWSVLTDDDLRKRYDDNYEYIPFPCIGSTCISYAHPKGTETSRRYGYKSEISKRYFCSEACANDWEGANLYTVEVHGYPEGAKTPPASSSTPPPGITLKNCFGCKRDKRFTSHWVKYNPKNPTDTNWCCTEYCLFEYLTSVGKNPKQCNECYVCRKEEERGWYKGEKDKNKTYCSEECKRTKENDTGFGLGDSGSTPPGSTPPGSTPPGSTPPGLDIKVIRANTINLIKSSLSKKPEILVSELSEINWEDRINRETKESIIEQIRDKILSDIVVRRRNKIQRGGLKQLIVSAQTAKNNNEITRLGEFLVEIKSKYQNTGIYLESISVIEELEKHYSTHAQKIQVQRNIIASLTAILQNNPSIDIYELDEQNRDFAQVIQNAASLQESREIEERVRDNINEKRTGKVVNNLFSRATRVDKDNKEEMARLRQEIMSLKKSKDKWEKFFWNENTNNFEEILLEWSGGKKNDQNNDSSFLKDILPIGLTVLGISGMAFAIWYFDIIRRLKQRKKVKKIG